MDLPKKASVEDEKRADNPTNLTIVGTLPTRGYPFGANFP